MIQGNSFTTWRWRSHVDTELLPKQQPPHLVGERVVQEVLAQWFTAGASTVPPLTLHAEKEVVRDLLPGKSSLFMPGLNLFLRATGVPQQKKLRG
jgi:hypothetical protein